jgi:hypothetical protein
MTLLLTSLNLLEIHHLKNMLEAEGIRCWIKNEFLARMAGEIPFTECSLELHLLHAEDWPRAQPVLEAWRHEDPRGAPWTCQGCGESLEGQFSVCWSCGASRCLT